MDIKICLEFLQFFSRIYMVYIYKLDYKDKHKLVIGIQIFIKIAFKIVNECHYESNWLVR